MPQDAITHPASDTHTDGRPILKYDVITIGSGGGSKIAGPAFQLGLSVAMVESGFDVNQPGGQPAEYKRGLGGTCLNRGCIPSKMLIHPADIITEMEEGKHLFKINGTIGTSGGTGENSHEKLNFKELIEKTSEFIDGDSESIFSNYNKDMTRIAKGEKAMNAAGTADKNRILYSGKARFIAPKILEITERACTDPAVKVKPADYIHDTKKKLITAENIFIAVGAEPAVPPIPGLKGTPYITSTEALRGVKLPKKVIVIGAGYISVELGHMFAALGADMHMFARSELLRLMDVDARKEFAKVFKDRYKNVYMNTDFEKVEYNKEKKEFTMWYKSRNSSDPNKVHTITADQLLCCTGVFPSGPSLSIENCPGIEWKYATPDKPFDPVAKPNSAFIKVDDRLRTGCPGVFALGDCIGNYLFRHCVNYEGEYLVENVIYPLAAKKGLITDKTILKQLTENPQCSAHPNNAMRSVWAHNYPPIDYSGGMPWAVFSNPQVAGIGKSEDELMKAGMVKDKDYVVGINLYRNSGMGDARRSDSGLVKVICSTKDREMLGVVMVGYEASTMIHQCSAVFANKGKLEDQLSRMIYIHPALNEILKGACRKARDALLKVEGCEVPLRLRLS